MSEFDAKTVLDDTVENIEGKLDKLSADQLQALHDTEKEKGNDARTTLLDALHRRMKAGDAVGKDGKKDDGKTPPPPPPPSPPEQASGTAWPEPGDVLELPEGNMSREAVLDAARFGRVRVLATDADGKVQDIPAMPERPTFDFSREGRGRISMKEEVFIDEKQPPATIRQYWLVSEDDGVLARSEIPVALYGGNGRRAILPARSVGFVV